MIMCVSMLLCLLCVYVVRVCVCMRRSICVSVCLCVNECADLCVCVCVCICVCMCVCASSCMNQVKKISKTDLYRLSYILISVPSVLLTSLYF